MKRNGVGALPEPTMNAMTTPECLLTLSDHAQAADSDLVWPEASWQALARAGVLGWSIDQGHGGSALGPSALLSGYEQLAGACLTTCFILSQRESAVRHLKHLPNEGLRR